MDHSDNNRQSISNIKSPPEQYMPARTRAVQLSNELSVAKTEMVTELISVIKRLQNKFMSQYSEKIYELEDLEEGISNVQKKGLKDLTRKLQVLYLESESNNTTHDKEQIKLHAKQITDEYKRLYCPKDDYYYKKKKEAEHMRNLFFLDNQSQSVHDDDSTNDNFQSKVLELHNKEDF